MKQSDAVRQVLKLCECADMSDGALPIDMRWDVAAVSKSIYDRPPAQLRAMLEEAVMLISGLGRHCTREGQTTLDPIREIALDTIRFYEQGWDYEIKDDGADGR